MTNAGDAVPFPAKFKERLGWEFRMGVWWIDVSLRDGTVVRDLFTNGVEIYRLVDGDRPGFAGGRAAVGFTAQDIEDIRERQRALGGQGLRGPGVASTGPPDQ